MKKLVLSCLMLLFVFAAVAQEKAATEKVPQITFQETEYQFGDVQQGDRVEHIFTFKNTGTAALILSNVLTTCGCTAPEWPKEPIAPGQSGQIKITFNTAGKTGKQNKVITVVSNATNAQERVALIGNILPKQSADLQ
jgi:hypothetical protein